MKAVGYKKLLPIGSAESFMDIEMSPPTASGRDLLAKVEAISVNLVDVKVRASAAPEGMPYKILGWNAGGVVVGVGSVKHDHDLVQGNLKRFDQLDFEAYSERKNMKLFREIHCPDVKVVFPDGRTTEGIEPHVTDINGLFNGTPDSRITAHPIAFGAGEWTVTTGVMEATFSEPMKLPDGKTIAPTGKKVKMPMATIAG